MANKERGEVALDAGDKSYTLRFSIDAMCHLEEASGRGIVAITQEFSDPEQIRMVSVRAALWAGLREHHPDLTLVDAGEIIPKAGGLQVVLTKVSEAIMLAFPKPDPKVRPRKATRTGLTS